jgi:hypothetical protein
MNTEKIIIEYKYNRIKRRSIGKHSTFDRAFLLGQQGIKSTNLASLNTLRHGF